MLCSFAIQVVADGVRGGRNIGISCDKQIKNEMAYWECIWLQKESKELMAERGKIKLPLLNDAGKEKLSIGNKWQNVPIGGL